MDATVKRRILPELPFGFAKPTRFSLLLFLLVATALTGCGRGKTTDTKSSSLATIEERKAFLEQYVSFRREYSQLDFAITYSDGGAGLAPGPSEWDIRIAAKVASKDLAQWIDGLKPAAKPDTDWVADIPNPPADPKSFEWYEDKNRLVGIDRKNSMILYRNNAF